MRRHGAPFRIALNLPLNEWLIVKRCIHHSPVKTERQDVAAVGESELRLKDSCIPGCSVSPATGKLLLTPEKSLWVTSHCLIKLTHYPEADGSATVQQLIIPRPPKQHIGDRSCWAENSRRFHE